MTEDSMWWEVSKLKVAEEKQRNSFTKNNFDYKEDFGSYKALKEGVSIKDSGLINHNICSKKIINNVLNDYIELLKKENIKAPRSIADYGCGAGFTTNVLKEIFQDASVIGYEISYDAVDYARTNFPNCLFEQKAIDPGSLDDKEQFDLIFCQEFYPFNRSTDKSNHEKWLNFISRNLNKNGIAIIAFYGQSSETMNSNYQYLRKKFKLRRYILINPRISSKCPLIMSKFLGNIIYKISLNIKFLKRYRYIFILKK